MLPDHPGPLTDGKVIVAHGAVAEVIGRVAFSDNAYFNAFISKFLMTRR